MNKTHNIRLEIDNLDAFNDADDMRELSEILFAHARYAAAKSVAMEERQKGNINLALKYEAKCDMLYEAMAQQGINQW